MAKHSEEAKRKMKEAWIARRQTFIPPMKGKKMSDASRAKMSVAAKKRDSNRTGKKHTIDSRIKMSRTVRERTPRGERANGYIDGKGVERSGLRSSPEAKRWRYDVFSRDKFTCKECGDSRGGNLNAHHIKPFADYPELRFDVSNGITLCWDCHDKNHAAKVSRFRRRKARGQLALPL